MNLLYSIIYMMSRAFFWTISVYLIVFALIAGVDEAMFGWALISLILATISELSLRLIGSADEKNG